MGELESLLLVLAVIYLAECIVWVRRGTVVFIHKWGGAKWRLWQPGTTVANAHGAVLFTNPLPSLGCVIVGTQPPLSISSEAVLSFTAGCLNSTWRQPQPAHLIRLAEIQRIERDGRIVLVNGSVFLKAISSNTARVVVRWLRQVQESSSNERQTIIRKAVGEAFDEKKIRERIQDFQHSVHYLRIGAVSLFVFLYVLAPLLVWRFGLRATIWPLVAILLAHTVTLALLFRRAHLRLYPGHNEERFTPFLTMLLAPPSAIRAQDVLAKHFLPDFHALAIAHVLASPETFREFARSVLLDLRHPIYPVSPGNDPLATATEEWFRSTLREAAERFVASTGLSVETLVQPPIPSEAAHAAYCQRCGAQFTTIQSTCGECGGRPLVTFSRERPRGS